MKNRQVGLSTVMVRPANTLTCGFAKRGIMEQIAKINDSISVPDCETTGTVKDIKTGHDAISPDVVPIYEIDTSQGMMRIPADWLARLIRPDLEAGRTEPFHNI